MKIRHRINNIIMGIRNGMKRFPITIGFSILITILLIYFNENRFELSELIKDRLIRVNMVVGMAILLSACIDLLKENFFKDERPKILISYIAGIVVLAIYYLFLLKDFSYVSVGRYTGTMVFLVLAFFYIPRLKRDKDIYEYYVVNILSNVFLTATYSIVLLMGLFAIFFTIDKLFDIEIVGKVYYYTFLLVVFVFAVSFFLSKIPENSREFIGYKFPKSLRILLSYIVIPLITVYTIILYIYFAKILISQQWPKGLVSHLVLWYSSISVGIIFLTNKIVEEDRVSRWFKKIFPKIILPILLMMFISIGQRINQYGITENRYYILVLGIWVTGMMIYFSVKGSLKTIVVPVSLSLIVLNSVFGPLSSFAVSNFSQNRRLIQILNENNMLEGNSIVINPDLSLDTQEEINNIIYYFDNRHSLKDIKILDDDFSLDNTKDIFGFAYEPHMSNGHREYIYIHTNINEEIIPIEDYDYFVNIVSWSKDSFSIDDIDIVYEPENNILTISDNDGELVKIDLKEVIVDIYNRLNRSTGEFKDKRTVKEMTYNMENDKIKLELIFTSFSGELDRAKDITDIRGNEFVILFKKK